VLVYPVVVDGGRAAVGHGPAHDAGEHEFLQRHFL